MNGQLGEIHATIQITRAATGLTEEYHLRGAATLSDAESLGATIEPTPAPQPADKEAP